MIKSYLSLIKFSHTVFALPFAIIGFGLGVKSTSTGFSVKLFVLVLSCMVFARSAAMAFNRYLDRSIDTANPRTVVREIPAGMIKPVSALVFTIVCSIGFISTTWLINSLCFYLAPVALLVILGYSYTKRFTALCHFVLGTGLSLAPIGSYIAVTGKFALLPLFFSFAVLFWVSGFDIIYALQDEEFDKDHRLKSVPAVLGKARALHVSRMLHILSSLSLIAAGVYGSFGLFYWIGVIAFTSMFVYQHSLVKPDDLSKVNLAFFTTNGIASVVFGALVLIELFFAH